MLPIPEAGWRPSPPEYDRSRVAPPCRRSCDRTFTASGRFACTEPGAVHSVLSACAHVSYLLSLRPAGLHHTPRTAPCGSRRPRARTTPLELPATPPSAARATRELAPNPSSGLEAVLNLRCSPKGAIGATRFVARPHHILAARQNQKGQRPHLLRQRSMNPCPRGTLTGPVERARR